MECRGKWFDGYFGLDGLTFGILDFTAGNLPSLFQIYQKSWPDKFAQTFASLSLPMRGNSLDPEWVCKNTREGYFNCISTVMQGSALPSTTRCMIPICRRASSNWRGEGTTSA